MTRRSGCAYGSGRSTTPRRRLNTPAADPVPSPSASIAAIVKLGARRRVRNAKRRSFSSVDMPESPVGALRGRRENTRREGESATRSTGRVASTNAFAAADVASHARESFLEVTKRHRRTEIARWRFAPAIRRSARRLRSFQERPRDRATVSIDAARDARSSRTPCAVTRDIAPWSATAIVLGVGEPGPQ